MDPRVPVWLLCFVYAMSISCTVCGEKKGSVNYEFQPTEEETDCNITIIHQTAEYLMVKFYEFNPDVAYFKLKFPDNSVVKFNEEVLQPFRWIWTFESKDRKLPFLAWDLDYAILSLGLLQEKTLPESWVEFDVQPPNCSITIGKRKSNLEIAYAFSNMINIDLHSLGIMYNNQYADSKNHSWCFAAEIPSVKDTFLYKLGIHFGSHVDFTQYNCCFSYYDIAKEKIYVNCSDHHIDMKGSTPGPYILRIIIFCCAPIFLLHFVSNRSGKEMERNDGFIQRRNGYILLDGIDNNENINYEDIVTSDFVYLTKHSPITLSSIIFETFLESKRHPRLASRLRRTLFIFLCPILVYAQLGIYGSTMRETTIELIKHGAPINFLTIFGGFERSRELFVPYLFGPYFSIFLFHVLGIVLLVLPENLEHLPEDVYPTTLEYDLVKHFSHMQIEEESGYGRLKLLSLARLRCTVNPSFWLHMAHVYLAGCKGCLMCLRNRLPTLLCYFLFLIIVPILFVGFFVAVFVCVLYFGNPWFCLYLPIKGLANFWIKRCTDKFAFIFKKYAICCTTIVCYFILVPFIWYFSYSMMIIVNNAVFFVTKVIVFLFTAVLVYPSAAFTYVLFCASLFHYFFKQIGGISSGYFDLLSDIVKSLNVLETEPNQLRVVDDTLIVPNGQSETIQKIQINGNTIQLSKEQLQTIRKSATQVNERLIRYKNKVPGIPRKLFRYVVKKHRPVFVSVCKALCPIVLIMMSMPRVMTFISYISCDSSQVTDVMKVVFIGFLPRILEMAFSGSNKDVLKEIFLKQLETTILEYKHMVQMQSPYDPDLETAFHM